MMIKFTFFSYLLAHSFPSSSLRSFTIKTFSLFCKDDKINDDVIQTMYNFLAWANIFPFCLYTYIWICVFVENCQYCCIINIQLCQHFIHKTILFFNVPASIKSSYITQPRPHTLPKIISKSLSSTKNSVMTRQLSPFTFFISLQHVLVIYRIRFYDIYDLYVPVYVHFFFF